MKRKKLRTVFLILIFFAAAGALSLIGVNAYVKRVTADDFITPKEAASFKGVDCILVLGCQVRDDGSPSLMLRDRLKKGVELYELKASPKILMSGDHGHKDYNEVAAMKEYALNAGVPSEDIFMDHAGFSTYESIYRAKAIFGADKVIIVTQKYHLYRALYIAKKLGIKACGASADYQTYVGQSYREVREILARVKDFATCIFKPKPTYLGDAIPLTGSGEVTED